MRRIVAECLGAWRRPSSNEGSIQPGSALQGWRLRPPGSWEGPRDLSREATELQHPRLVLVQCQSKLRGRLRLCQRAPGCAVVPVIGQHLGLHSRRHARQGRGHLPSARRAGRVRGRVRLSWARLLKRVFARSTWSTARTAARAEDHRGHPETAGHRDDPHAPGSAAPCCRATVRRAKRMFRYDFGTSAPPRSDARVRLPITDTGLRSRLHSTWAAPPFPAP